MISTSFDLPLPSGETREVPECAKSLYIELSSVNILILFPFFFCRTGYFRQHACTDELFFFDRVYSTFRLYIE